MHTTKRSILAQALVGSALLALSLAPAAGAVEFVKGGATGTVTGLGGKCLDVFMGGTTEGTPVVLYQCNGSPNQDWMFEFVGNDVRLRSVGNQCLRPGSIGSTGFVETEMGPCVGSDTLWRIGIISPTKFGLKHINTDECLDVFNSDTTDGNPVIIFGCTGTANQQWTFDDSGAGPGSCMTTSTQMCLNEGRFAVTVNWVKPDGVPGVGSVVSAGTDDSGLFYFFNSTNWEMLVKVLDNCAGPTNRFWVFAAASTTVQYTLRVTDTATGQVREYFNPQGNRAAAIADTQAFATCP